MYKFKVAGFQLNILNFWNEQISNTELFYWIRHCKVNKIHTFAKSRFVWASLLISFSSASSRRCSSSEPSSAFSFLGRLSRSFAKYNQYYNEISYYHHCNIIINVVFVINNFIVTFFIVAIIIIIMISIIIIVVVIIIIRLNRLWVVLRTPPKRYSPITKDSSSSIYQSSHS